MLICGWTPLTSYDRAEIDHIRLAFFQIRSENLKRDPPGFQFFVCFDVIMSEDQWQFWFATLTQNHIQLKTGWTPLSFFNPNLEKYHPYMVNLCLIMWHQRESTHISSSCHLWYVFWVNYLTTNDIQQLILLEIEHLIFFYLMFVLVGQIFIV